MGANSQKLTDRQFSELYLGLANHYADCVEQKMTTPVMYNELFAAIHYTLNDSQSTSPLKNLNDEEKAKIYNILNTFFHATPEYRNVPEMNKGKKFFNDGTLPPKIIIIQNSPRVRNCRYYRSSSDRFIDWLILNDIMNHSHQRGYYRAHYGNTHSHGSRGGVHHGHNGSSSSKGDNNIAEKLMVIILGTAILLGTFVALTYVVTQTNDWIERCVWNEGWMQATIALLGMSVATGIATLLIETVAFSAIMGLVASAGFSNPAGWATFAVMGLGVMVGVGISYFIQEQMPKNADLNAIDPMEPYRYKLSDSEAAHLESLNIDPIKVKLAIVALRSEMGKSADPRSLFRWMSKEDATVKNKVRHNLSVIRDLRFGKITVVQVGDMKFDCNMDALNNKLTPPAGNVYLRGKSSEPRYFKEVPSAPMEEPPQYQIPQSSGDEFKAYEYAYPILQPSAPLQEYNQPQYN